MKRTLKKTAGAVLALLMIISSVTVVVSAERIPTAEVIFTFTDTGITAEAVSLADRTDGYEIKGTSVTIKSEGTYKFTGSCHEGNITVKKGTENVSLILEDLDLSCSESAPLLLKKSAKAHAYVVGNVVLTDLEDPSTEKISETFEGAAIKVNSEKAELTLNGTGTLTLDGNSCKNGIKASSTSKIVIDGGAYVIKAANNGIAADGGVVINGGTISIVSGNDGIKSDDPDGGYVTINGGSIDITSYDEGIYALSGITVTGGSVTVNSTCDAIESSGFISISGGDFRLTTLGGHETVYSESAPSAKGIKADSDSEEEGANPVTITGGTFVIDTPDDAIHSAGTIKLEGGTFSIYTGDDGVHSDTDLIVGTEGGLERDPDITVHSCYEGLEAENVYIYSGRVHITADDDGINAAGGSSSGTDTWRRTQDRFGRGGGGSGGPGGPGGPGFTGAGEYYIRVYGGSIYIDCTGDGLDSNGYMYLYGGELTVLSQGKGGDNSPLDTESTLYLGDARVFAAGTNPMNETPSYDSNEYYVSRNQYSAGTIIKITSGNETLFSEKLPRTVNYILYCDPNIKTSASIGTSGSLNICVSHSWAHTWDGGTVTEAASADRSGIMTFTCTACGKTERQTIPASGAQSSSIEDEARDYVTGTVEKPSDWAADEVGKGIAEGLVPVELQKNYTTPVTRGQVAEMFINLLEKATGKTVDEIMAEKGVTINENAFTDTTDKTVLAANALGIINGTGNGKFSPDGTLKRAQIAAIINRVAKVMGVETEGYTHEFTDITDNYEWADSELGWPVYAGIINGVGGGKFNPGGDLTTEQAILITYRALGALG